jgi:hypothetical protein
MTGSERRGSNLNLVVSRVRRGVRHQHLREDRASAVRGRRPMLQLALLAGAAAVIAFAVTRALRTRFTSRKNIDLGAVSDGWLAAQRGAKSDS